MQWGLITHRTRSLPASLALAAVLLCGFADPVGHNSETPVAETPVVAALTLDDAVLLGDDAVFAGEAVKAAVFGSGRASFYADKFHGRRTASGEIFSQTALTAAHRNLPMGSLVRVTCDKSGKSVTVRVNDRGPFTGHRIIDLSKAAARELGMLNAGVADVTLELIPAA